MIIFVSKLIRKGYFYNTAKAEVDFYVPDRGMAIQVSYSIADEETDLFKRIGKFFAIQKDCSVH